MRQRDITGERHPHYSAVEGNGGLPIADGRSAALGDGDAAVAVCQHMALNAC